MCSGLAREVLRAPPSRAASLRRPASPLAAPRRNCARRRATANPRAVGAHSPRLRRCARTRSRRSAHTAHGPRAAGRGRHAHVGRTQPSSRGATAQQESQRASLAADFSAHSRGSQRARLHVHELAGAAREVEARTIEQHGHRSTARRGASRCRSRTATASSITVITSLVPIEIGSSQHVCARASAHGLERRSARRTTAQPHRPARPDRRAAWQRARRATGHRPGPEDPRACLERRVLGERQGQGNRITAHTVRDGLGQPVDRGRDHGQPSDAASSATRPNASVSGACGRQSIPR